MSQPNIAQQALTTLEGAITDVGRWSWWQLLQPSVFQIEFSGVQMWCGPPTAAEPPAGKVNIGIFGELSVMVLSYTEFSDQLPYDWFHRLHRNEIGPFPFSTFDQPHFTFSDGDKVRANEKRAINAEKFLWKTNVIDPSKHSFISFCAGSVGLIVVGDQLVVCDHLGKALTPETVLERNAQWWAYWEEYWKQKEAGHPFPVDHSCEATVPIEGGGHVTERGGE